MPLTVPADETVIHTATGPITLMPPTTAGGSPVPQTTGPIDKDAFPDGIEAIIKHTVYRRVVFGVSGVADGVVKRYYLKDVLPVGIKVLQSVPDTFLAAVNPNTQYRADNVGVNVHGVSYANGDKPSSTYVLTAGKLTSLNLAGAITAREAARALGLSTSHIHSATWWHNGHSSSQTWSATDWRSQIEIAVDGWIDGLHARGLWAGTETWDIVNETVDDANTAPVPASGAVPFVRQSKLTEAAKADPTWASDMAPFGLTAAEAGALGWLYALRRAKQKMDVNGHAAHLFKADYSIGESGAPWGPGSTPAGMPGSSANAHFMMRQERFFEDLQKAGAVRKLGYDIPTLHPNFQNHVKLSNQLFLDNIRDRQQRCNLLKKRVIIGEITLEIIADDVAQMLASIGQPVTQATIDRLGCNYIAMMLATIIEHTERLDAVQPWTALGAVGELVTSAYDLAGDPTCVYRGIQKAGQILPPRKAIRAAATHFGMPGASFRPYDFIPGASVQMTGLAGLRAPGSKMPWSHYQRVVADGGQQENMDARNWDQAVTFGVSGSASANAGLLIWGQESAAGNSLRIAFDANYEAVLQLYPASGAAMQTLPLGRVPAGSFARVVVAARGTGQVKAAMSVLDPVTGTVADLAPVAASVQLADPVNYLMPETVGRGVYKHKIWDVTDLVADAAALAERARLTNRLGSPLTVQDIWNGSLDLVGSNGGSNPPAPVAELDQLTLSASTYRTTDAPGTVIGRINNRTPGSALAIVPNDGRLAISEAEGEAKLVVGLAASDAGKVTYAIRETLAGAVYSPRSTSFEITAVIPVPPLTISGVPASGSVGAVYNFQPVVSGGSGTRRFILEGQLPNGLTFSSTTGAINGTPTVDGTFRDLAIAVEDSTGGAEIDFTIFVDQSASLLAYPRLALIGPSTVIQNHEAGLGNSNAAYNTQALASGPVVWALAKDRRAQCLIVTETTGNYIGGDNQAQFGVGFNEYPAQIDAIKTRMADVPVAQRIAYYEFGRNDLSTTTQVDRFKADIARDVNNLKSFGFGKILVAKLWKRHTSVGGEWASGGQARADVEAINAWLDTTYGNDPAVKLIDYASVLTDPASADGNPRAGFCRTDGTHFAPKGAHAAAKALNAVLAPLCRRRAYPAVSAENTIPALAGAGGTKTAVTGDVADGWTAVLSSDTSATVVGSVVDRDGKPYQRFTIGNAQGVPLTGAQLDFRKTTAVPVPAGAKVGLRYRCIIPANQFPIALFHLLGTGSTIGATTGASSYSLVSPTDASNATPRVTATGTGFQNAGKLPNEELLDLWIETPGFVLGASGGSNVGVSFRTLFGPAPAGQTLQIDIGEIQIFNWPIG